MFSQRSGCVNVSVSGYITCTTSSAGGMGPVVGSFTGRVISALSDCARFDIDNANVRVVVGNDLPRSVINANHGDTGRKLRFCRCKHCFAVANGHRGSGRVCSHASRLTRVFRGCFSSDSVGNHIGLTRCRGSRVGLSGSTL